MCCSTAFGGVTVTGLEADDVVPKNRANFTHKTAQKERPTATEQEHVGNAEKRVHEKVTHLRSC